MDPRRPHKTLADYLVIAISPALIMLLVGSLCFFLIQVFYRGEAADSVRWVMFWFVFAVVLLSRMSINSGSARAALYSFALAATTWLYLTRLHPAIELSMALLAIVWWCANRLTRDCTLIDEDADASGHGLLQPVRKPEVTLAKPIPKSETKKPRRRPPHSPGRWVIYFSLAALPLFGCGQMLLPLDSAARRRGFELLLVYLAAAVGLLLTTSFLGLRRYLRQRHLQMPGMIAFGWVRFGVTVAALVLGAALLLPRPGAGAAWNTLRYQIDYKLRQASDWAAQFNPHGHGEGHPGNDSSPGDQDQPGGAEGTAQGNTSSAKNPNGTESQTGGSTQNPPSNPPDRPAPVLHGSAVAWYRILRTLFLIAVAAAFCWGLVRHRLLIARVIRDLLETLAAFFRRLFGFRFGWKKHSEGSDGSTGRKHPAFATFENPFLTGRDRSWALERLILYSYEAVRTWAAEKGSEPQPQQTAREFCFALSDQFPEVRSELNHLSVLYSHAAYGMKMPEPCDLEPVRLLWRHLTTPSA